MSGATNNYLAEVPNAIDVDDPQVTASTRFRIGYPQLNAYGPVVTDATLARHVMEGIPAASLPAYDDHDNPVAPADPLADVKRALSYEPATGINFITGARFNAYLKDGLDTRVADGPVLFQAVDQDFQSSDGPKPGLSYLRLGKGEPKPAPEPERPDDRLMDQRYVSGIGLFSDGALNAWTCQPINLRSNLAINLTTPAYCLATYGESVIVTYEIEDEEDIARINAGELLDDDVERTIVNVNALRSTDLGWYRQIFDRGRNLEYSTSNKGEFGIGATYSLGVGAKFEHSLAVGLETALTGKVEINKGFTVEIGATGAIFKHPSGSWTQENDAELSANSSVCLTVAGIDTAPIQAAMKTYSVALQASVAVQTAAFMAYNAVLAGEADRPLTGADTKDRGDDTHGLKTALDHGMKVYEAALSLSAITCAAGIVMAAVQAAWSAARVPDPTTPDIEVSREGIFLRYGGNGIQIDATGVKIVGLTGGVTIGGVAVTHAAPVVNHQPVPPIIPVSPRIAAL